MTHPYSDAASHRLWRRAVSAFEANADPIVNFPFRISPSDKIVTAGGCFAPLIANRLQTAGYNFLVTEKAHPLLPEETAALFNYGRHSARYGSVHTARQLLQLLRRAYGRFEPIEDVWFEGDNKLVDPFRPLIQPDGFACIEEYRLDRAQHFAAVREAFETMDVFIYIFSMTECWENRKDGAVFPLCPGVAGGQFDESVHAFRNQDVGEVVSDMSLFLEELRDVNKNVRVILAVSPVQFIATGSDDHVLCASIYSKAVHRAACETITKCDPAVAYFPSYEIIAGPQTRGRYFDDDLRSVTDAGVDRVMDLFFKHVTDEGAQWAASGNETRVEIGVKSEHVHYAARAQSLTKSLCDAVLLDLGG